MECEMSFRVKSIRALAAWNLDGMSGVGGPRPRGWLRMALAASLAAMAIGCGSGGKSTVSAGTPANPSQLYFAPRMDSGSQATYAIDHTANPNTFVRSTYNAQGELITDAGEVSSLSNGIDSLSATYIYGGGNGTVNSVSLTNPVTGGWVVELPDQAALVELNIPPVETSEGTKISAVNYFTPAVPTQSCPSLKTAQTFQFVTIPRNLPAATETAYGSVKIATSGSTIEFSGASTYNFSGVSCTATAIAGATSCVTSPAGGANQVTSVCSPTYYGQVISVPGASTVNGNGIASPTAAIGIGPSGFLVEDSGVGASAPDPVTGLTYENILGAGYGAIGLPQPSSDLTASLAGAQYQGFLYSPGSSSSAFRLIGSFGASSNSQSSCATLLADLSAYLSANKLPSLTNPIYGGDYGSGINGSNDPTSGNINCDMAIDLGTQAASSNGLYIKATVYVGAAFPANGSGAIYPFPAVAVAGQLQGKNAIFFIGADTTGSPSRAWGIYLLQSN
jgi:hypothetical protein